jgi:hypothetical protein
MQRISGPRGVMAGFPIDAPIFSSQIVHAFGAPFCSPAPQAIARD